ncbi:MAG: acylneuraminate cytidylyltransferase family protein [bacterium]|nr:acylneuraminate cytidylyltransferase family protein [bacterium]
MKNVCIIPARGGSKRIPLKNIIDFAGKPLMVHSIEAAQKSGLFGDDIYVSSDSEQILDVAVKYGAKPLRRPDAISGDKANLEDATLDLLKQLAPKKFDHLCMMMPASPLVEGDDLKQSYKELMANKKSNCSMSVVKYPHYPFWALQEKKGFISFFFKKYLIDSKLLPKDIYCPIAAIRWVEVKNFLKEKKFYGKKLSKFVMPFEKSADIDTYEDIEFAEKLYKLMKMK